MQAPPQAHSARVRLMLRPQSAAPATVYFDSVTFSETEPPEPTETPTPHPSATPRPPTPSRTATTSPATPRPPTPSRTATAAPTRTPSSTPTAGNDTEATDTPTPVPQAFAQLTNGGFEDADGDGSPFGWLKVGGEIALNADARTAGTLGLELRSESASTKWAYQTLIVEPGAYYSASVQAAKDVGAGALFLRLTWYASDDGSGTALSSVDSDLLEGDELSFHALTIAGAQAPGEARSVKLKLMLRPASADPATAHFDEVQFGETDPPSPTGQPTSAPTQTPTPDDAVAAADGEPLVFPALVNSDFEQLRPDGSPYAWRNTGGQLAETALAASGGHALLLTSATASAKWAYQAVLVQPDAYYQASALALVHGGEAFLRLSWYESEVATGRALSSADSTDTVTGDSGSFAPLSTGPVQAPADARSVKVRLMLRPDSAVEATAIFDSVQLWELAKPPAGDATTSRTSAVAGRSASTLAAQVLGAASTPIQLANVKPAPQTQRAAQTNGDGGTPPWAIALAIVLPTGALAAGTAWGIGRRHPHLPSGP